MKNTEIETRLAAEISNEVPDVLERILMRCEDRDERVCEVIALEDKRKRVKWQKPLYAAVAVFALLAGVWQYQAAHAVEAVVMLDINPSLALELNKNETVLSASGVNEDGKAVLDQVEGGGNALKGKKLDAAVEELLASMTEAGYLNAQSCAVLVTVSGADPEKSAALSSRLTESISNGLAQKGMDGAVLGQSLGGDEAPSGLAEQYGISRGKAELIEKILVKDPRLSFEALAGLSVGELGLLADEWVKSNQLENVILIGKISAKGYVSAEAAVDRALSQANITVDGDAEVGVSVGIDEGKLVYDISLKTNEGEYQCEVDAKSGLIINWLVNSESGGLNINGQLSVREDGKIGIDGEISLPGQASGEQDSGFSDTQPAETPPPAPDLSHERIIKGVIDIIGKIADKAVGA